MIPIFDYGEDISSSAAVESSFKKLKNITMKHINLPTNIEIFLENHIQALKGYSLIRYAKNEIHHLSSVNNDNYSTPQTMCGVLEEGASGIDSEERSCNGIESCKVNIYSHKIDDSENIMVDDTLIATLNDEIAEERNRYTTYPLCNVGRYNIYFENYKRLINVL